MIKDLPEWRRIINLVEECGELVQASVKYLRAQYGDTPVPFPDVKNQLLEEMADVGLCMDMVNSPADRIKIRAIRERKKKRWEERIEQEAEALCCVRGNGKPGIQCEIGTQHDIHGGCGHPCDG